MLFRSVQTLFEVGCTVIDGDDYTQLSHRFSLNSVKNKTRSERGGRMFENRILANGSAYLAEPYSPTSVQDRNRHKNLSRYAWRLLI